MQYAILVGVMVRTRQQSQDKLLAYLASQALEQRRTVLLFPSVGYLKTRTRQDFDTVDNALDWLTKIGRIDHNRNTDGSIWIDLHPKA